MGWKDELTSLHEKSISLLPKNIHQITQNIQNVSIVSNTTENESVEVKLLENHHLEVTGDDNGIVFKQIDNALESQREITTETIVEHIHTTHKHGLENEEKDKGNEKLTKSDSKVVQQHDEIIKRNEEDQEPMNKEQENNVEEELEKLFDSIKL